MNKTKKAGVRPVTKISQVLYDQLRKDYQKVCSKCLRAFDLRQLGYVLDSTHRLKLGEHFLWMVLDEDTMREVGFSFLVYKNSITGACIPNSYSYYTETAAQGQDGGAR